MDIQKLEALIARGEGPKLDFKLKLSLELESSKKELAKDVCAIANSRGGRGYLLFGIEDKTKNLVGINAVEFKEERIQQVVYTRLDPPVPISVEVMHYNGVDIGIIVIYSTDQKPYQLRETGTFYIRRGSTTDILRKEEIASMIQDNGLLDYELLPIPRAYLNDLDLDKIKEYFLQSGINANIDNYLLMNTGITIRDKDSNEYHPTTGGMLLFGIRPDSFLPHTLIKIYNKINKDLPYHFVATGAIMDKLTAAADFIKACIPDKDFPFEVIEDLLGNAMIHRDYFDINNIIQIYINKDYIEIINPGSAIKENNQGSERYIRRNSWLYLRTMTIDKNRKFFNKDINTPMLMKNYGRINYHNVIHKNLFKTIIPIAKKG